MKKLRAFRSFGKEPASWQGQRRISIKRLRFFLEQDLDFPPPMQNSHWIGGTYTEIPTASTVTNRNPPAAVMTVEARRQSTAVCDVRCVYRPNYEIVMSIIGYALSSP